VTAEDLHGLLALQELDSAADLIAVRRRTMPERQAVEAIEARLRDLRQAAAARNETRQKLEGEQAELEAELAGADARDRDLAARLRTIFVPREAEAVMAEQRSLAARRAELEDVILERMEQLAALDDEEHDAGAVRDVATTELAAAEEVLAAAEHDLDAQLAAIAARRGELHVPDELLRRYDALRPRFDGVAVARLEGGRCGGCHLSLSTSELDRIRHEPADALIECEHCGRLLVR
jgi:uncharacterized protein